MAKKDKTDVKSREAKKIQKTENTFNIELQYRKKFWRKKKNCR